MLRRELFPQLESSRRSPLAALLSPVLHGAAAAGVMWLASVQLARPPIPPEQRLSFLRVILARPPLEAIEPLRKVPPLETAAPEPPREPDVPELAVKLSTPPEPIVPGPPTAQPTIAEPPRPRRPDVKLGDFAGALGPTPKVDQRQVLAVGFDVQQAVAPDIGARRADVGTFESQNAIDPRPGTDRPAATLASGFENAQALSAEPRTVRTVANSGFGSSSAAPQAAAAREPVKPAGFAGAPPAPAATGRQRTEKGITPLEVLFKPTPDCSAEARALKLEGTVTLEVQFPAVGQARVLRVVHGLGHGLDEMAIRAAEEIRFKPAQSAGSPVEVTASVQIVFRLT
jgi:TonB family protein